MRVLISLIIKFYSIPINDTINDRAYLKVPLVTVLVVTLTSKAIIFKDEDEMRVDPWDRNNLSVLQWVQETSSLPLNYCNEFSQR